MVTDDIVEVFDYVFSLSARSPLTGSFSHLHPTLTLSSMTSNQLMEKKNPLLIAPAGDIIITGSLAVKVLDWPLNTLPGRSVLPVSQFPASPVRSTNLEQER